jgi:hypothetical protein
MSDRWRDHVAKVSEGEQGLPVVEIFWTDALSFALDWQEESSSALMETVAVGYLVEETEDAVSVVSLVNKNHLGHGITIPKVNIIWWRDLT